MAARFFQCVGIDTNALFGPKNAPKIVTDSTTDEETQYQPLAAEDPASLEDVNGTVELPQTLSKARRFFAFVGPGFLVAVGYMDPGNWSTDIAGGSAYNYDLLFIVLLSSLLAMILQSFCVRLGAGIGKDLAQACRDQYPRKVNFFLWLLAEAAIAACDLAEVIGSAIALQLLTGLPLIAGVFITTADVLIVLAVAGRNIRGLEILIASLIFLIGGCFVFELAVSKPDPAELFSGFIPRARIFSDPKRLYIAIGIIGATVMPHNLYLHSAVVQTRKIDKTVPGRWEAIRYATIDSTLALFIAFFMNASILIVAAAAFFRSGQHEVADLHDAHNLLAPTLGSGAASTLFAVALLAAGQQSTITGTMAGQIVMEGFLGKGITLKPWLRRLVTRIIAVVPAAVVAGVAGDDGVSRLLNLSQVILSLQLPFAVFPLVHFTTSSKVMGEFVLRWWWKIPAWLIFLLLAGLNVKLVVDFGITGGEAAE